VRSLAERFATSEAAQAAICCRPLHKASELASQPDADAHGKLVFLCILCYLSELERLRFDLFW